MRVIPLNKLAAYMDNFHISCYICQYCKQENERIFIPYAYDKQSNDVIFFASKCKHCGKINLAKE